MDAGERLRSAPFETLVERHGPMILRTCQRILRNDQDAQDAFQATFLILLRKSRSLWVRESLGPWLHRIACRAAIRTRTAQVRRQTVLQELTALVDGPAPSAPSHELVGVIHEEIDRLPDHYRAAIVLCDLEGHTCEQTAQLLGCPLGTVGSRLARGREKLRGRLIRRGMAPAAGTVAAALSHDALGSMPTPLVEMTLHAAMGNPAPSVPAVVSSAAAKITREISRSLFMAKFQAIAAVTLTAAGLCLLSMLSYRAASGSQPPATQAVEKVQEKIKKPADQNTVGGLVATDFGNDPVRYKDYLIATIGNSLFNRDQEKTVPVNRMAVLYRDGIAKLWSFDSKDPVCPPLRDTRPIREIAFQQNSGILVTAAETSVEIWNAVTGKLIKEMPGQVVRPLAFATNFIARRSFVTIDTQGQMVTIWNSNSLEAVDRFQPVDIGSKPLIGASLSPDGGTLMTVAEDRSVSLCDVATKQCFATFRPPSQLCASVFHDDACPLFKRPVLQINEHFWETVNPLKPLANPSEKK